MGQDFIYLVDLNAVQLDESGQSSSSWIHALPYGDYTHPTFGKLHLTTDKITGLAESVKSKARGIDPSINYEHKGDGEAAGWVKDAEARDTGLWLFVEWTTSAAQKLKEKAFRYFSSEFYDSWKDPSGKEHRNVLFGGALTNRPYMKNLLPINLSEAAIEYSFGLVEAINKSREGEKDMDLEKLNKALGLAEGTSEEDAYKKLAELSKPPVIEDAKHPAIPTVSISEEMKRMAEENPLFRSVIETLDAQNAALRNFQVNLVEADIAKKLAEFDGSKIVLTPVAKDRVHDLLLDMPVELHERLWEVLKVFKDNSGLMVELGERAGTTVKYGRSKDSVDLFLDTANSLAQTEKISLDEAMNRVSREQPDLYNGYRAGSYSFTE